MTTAEYIEREAATAFLENMAASRYLIQCFESKEKFPAADVVEVRHGAWVYRNNDVSYWCECSVCERTPPRNSWGHEYHSEYCPNCGAKMDGKGEGE